MGINAARYFKATKFKTVLYVVFAIITTILFIGNRNIHNFETDFREAYNNAREIDNSKERQNSSEGKFSALSYGDAKINLGKPSTFDQDRTEKIKHSKSKKCSNKFELLKLHHFNETYDDVIIERHPNLPKFLTESGIISSSVPDIPRIRWTGTVYQESWKKSPKFLLYSAFYDTRLNSDLFIHILALYDGEKIENGLNFKNYFCKTWLSPKDHPVAVPVYDSFRISNLPYEESRLSPYVLSCKMPRPENAQNEYPISVSLVRGQCEIPKSVLKISASPVKKPKSLNKNITVGICGKALFYYNNDFSYRLIEWVEVLRNLGVSKIFLYKIKCHKNIQKVFDFYEKEGIVKVITFHYPPPIVQEGTFIRLWSRNEKIEFWSVQNIYINDCLLRNKDDFDYLGVMDSDEIPIMKNHQSLPEFLMYLRQRNNQPESYFFKWKTFFRDLKSNTLPSNETDRSYIFSHNIRTKLNSKEAKIFETNGKTFYDTSQVTFAYPHKNLEIISNLVPSIELKTLSRDVAYMGHFTDHKCVKKEHCFDGNTEEETALLPFREKVVHKMNEVLNILKI